MYQGGSFGKEFEIYVEYICYYYAKKKNEIRVEHHLE